MQFAILLSAKWVVSLSDSEADPCDLDRRTKGCNRLVIDAYPNEWARILTSVKSDKDGIAPLDPVTVFGRSSSPRTRYVFLVILCLATLTSVASSEIVGSTGLNPLTLQIFGQSYSATIYLPLILCTLLTLWFGLWWGFVPAYLATLYLSLTAGMPAATAVLFALADPLSLAVYTLAFGSFGFSHRMRSLSSVAFFAGVSFIAAIAGSIASFIWSWSLDLDPQTAFEKWQGWWLGGFLQSVLVIAPLLAIFTGPVEAWKRRRFPGLSETEWTARRFLTGVVVCVLLLGVFVVLQETYANLLFDRALEMAPVAQDAARIANRRSDIAVGMAIVAIMVVLGGSGIGLAFNWTRSLNSEVRRRTAELIESERRNREMRSLYQSLFEMSPELICIYGRDGIRLINSAGAAMLGASSPEELRGRDLRSLVTPPYRWTVDRRWTEILERRQPIPLLEQVYVGLDGRHVTVEIAGTPIDVDGEHQALIFARDITARRRAEEEARARKQQLDRFEQTETVGTLAAAIAHEVVQPVSAIVSYAGGALRLLDGSPPPLDEIRRALTRIREEATRTGAIVKRVRDRGTGSGRSVEAVDLAALLSEVVSDLAPDAAAADVEIEYPTSGAPVVMGDDIGMRIVFRNLIRNAVQACTDMPRDRRRVTIEAEPAGDMIALSIRDRGPGLPQDRPEDVFEPFISTREGGMGLGLAIARRIVEEAGGRIAAENNPGGGATFVVTLPREAG